MLTYKEINNIKKYGSYVEYKPNQVLIHENKEGDIHCFFIIKGTLGIYKNGKKLDKLWEQKLIWTWGLLSWKRNNSVIAEDEVAAIKLDEIGYEQLKRDCPKLIEEYSLDSQKAILLDKDNFLYINN